jgi:hypothetical protein
MIRRYVAAAIVAVGAAIAAPAAAGAHDHDGAGKHVDLHELKAIRDATVQFRDVGVARGAGYELFPDAAGITCIDKPGTGAMGTHYVSSALVGDGEIVASEPEAMVYEHRNGKPFLVAVEYVVLQTAWDSAHSAPPSLFGQQFDVTPDGNRYGIPAFYSLHAWVWKHNPAGELAMWNPVVRCPSRIGGPR